VSISDQIQEIAALGRKDYGWFMRNALDVKPEHYWEGMERVCASVRDNPQTAVSAGHGVSKTYVAARIALTFLYCYVPSIVVTTAPSEDQVKGLLWREMREAHANARIPMGGKVSTLQIDMQPESGLRWFAIGVATKPDTVTGEATRLQGYHSPHFLFILDEAAAILPEIWKAVKHVGGPFKRVLAIGNATSSTGEFVAALKSPNWNRLQISVKDTPNFINSNNDIPGLYGTEYERDIRTTYGEDSDEYAVRVLGAISAKAALGSYYGRKLDDLESKGRICDLDADPHKQVHIVRDPGYTSAFWFFQLLDYDVHFIRYHEDSGLGVEDYARYFDELRRECGYIYGDNIVPCDMDNNAGRVITGQTALETLQDLAITCGRPVALQVERTEIEGIERTVKFLTRARFDKTLCAVGLDRLRGFHERINKQMSTEDHIAYTGSPDKDGINDHGAAAMRYASKAIVEGKVGGGSMTAQDVEDLWNEAKR